jgi:D-serine deaminase-like pyridoxal phosphate-dependent protein
MIDHESQVQALEAFATSAGKQVPWDVFIKVDEGSHRAGLELNSESSSLSKVIERVESSSATSLIGFYCHAGRSYLCCSEEGAASLLDHEIETLVEAVLLHAKLVKSRPLILSFGATPTAHVISRLKTGRVPKNCTLELHGGRFSGSLKGGLLLTTLGCYPANDLQQLSTGSISEIDLAAKVVAEVCSIYPDRNEALINAGVLALSRETSHGFPGFGNVVGSDWKVGRLSQEHGILVASDATSKVEDSFKVGQKVLLNVQHVCIAVAGYGWYYVVDDSGIVIEIWFPWRGWQ